MGVSDDADEARTRFLALAQHKLNTPLAVITGWSATLLDWDRLEPEERTVGLDAINRAALELQAQVQDVLDEARARLLERSIRVEPLELAPFVEHAVSQFAHDVERHRIDVEIEPDTWAFADEIALDKVLSHVLDNAVTYSPEGGPVEVSARTDEGFCTLEVRDHGIGLPEDVDVFEPFRRGNTARSVARGTGLGLHVVRCLMAAMEGRVSARRVPDGTVVELSLPTG